MGHAFGSVHQDTHSRGRGDVVASESDVPVDDDDRGLVGDLGEKHAPIRTTITPTTDENRQATNCQPNHQRLDMLVQWLNKNGFQVSKQQADTVEDTRLSFDPILHQLQDMEAILEQQITQLGGSSTEVHPSSLVKSQPQPSPRNSEQNSIVEYLVVISPDVADLQLYSLQNRHQDTYCPSVAFVCPPEHQFEAEGIEHFCFPSGIRLSEPETDAGETFALILSGSGKQGQDILYAYCMKKRVNFMTNAMKVLALPLCYCVVSHLPLFSCFHQLLLHLFETHQIEISRGEGLDQHNIVSDEHAHYIHRFMTAIAAHKPKSSSPVVLPFPGIPLHQLFPPSQQVLLPSCRDVMRAQDHPSALLLDWALPTLLNHVSIERVWRVLCCLLMEMKVIVVAKDLHILSTTVLALTSLLSPLVWAGSLIVVLPSSLKDYLEAPVPYLIGVQRLPEDFDFSSGMVALFAERDQVELCDEIAVPHLASFRLAPHELLPQDLVERIRTHIEQLIHDEPTRSVNKESALLQRVNQDGAHDEFFVLLSQSQMLQSYRDTCRTQTQQVRARKEPEQLVHEAAAPLKAPTPTISLSLAAPTQTLFRILLDAC